MGAQAFAAGLRRYTLRRAALGGRQAADAALSLPHVYPALGTVRQLEAWGAAICAFNERGQGSSSSCGGPRAPSFAEEPPAESSALNAIVDLMVVGAMVQSRGTTVQIRETGTGSLSGGARGRACDLLLGRERETS